MVVGSIIGAIIGLAISTVVAGLLIWLVAKLGLGIEVDGFGPALLTGFVIGVAWLLATLFWNLIGYTPAEGFAGAITHLILTAGFLYGFRNTISGLRVNGFTGALIASAAIALITWLAGLALGGILPA